MLHVVLILALAGFQLVTASVQRPTPTSCSSSAKVQVSAVIIENAKIGQTMVVNFTLKVGESLGSNPTLQITVRKQSGSKIPCISNIGSWYDEFNRSIRKSSLQTRKNGETTPKLLNVVSKMRSDEICTYKLCGGTSSQEKDLTKLWNNQCPVPAITVQETIRAQLDSAIQLIIGNAPTTISIELKVTNGGTTVGCQSFKVMIEAA